MFDDELPGSECELLARRLARDEQLRTRWGHYAAIGACIRGEHGVRLETRLASMVSAAIKQEAVQAESSASGGSQYRFFNPWVASLGGVAAAAVAAVAIFWMRSAAPPAVVAQINPVQQSPVHPSIVRAAAPQLAAVAQCSAGAPVHRSG